MSTKKIEKKVFNSKEEYLNAIDIEDKKIDVAEDRIEELRRMLVDYDSGNDQTTVVKTAKKTNSSKKSTKKRAKPNDIPVDQKHTIVTVAEYDDYDYNRRRKEWHQKAGHNDVQVVCSKCKDDDNWATIQLENGDHICYYCWIKKPTTATKTKSKKASKKTTVKAKAKKTTKVQKPADIPVDQKHTIVSLAEYNDYNYNRRRKEWHQKAGHNDVQVVCSKCKDDDNWATIQLENGDHICYYCWIKKPTTATSTKPTVVKTTKVKTVEVKKEPKKVKNTPPKKHEQVAVELLDLYDYKKKLEIWRKSAGDNLTDQGCNQCGGKQYERTILLKDGRHICWYCWIRKPEGAISVSEYNKQKNLKKK